LAISQWIAQAHGGTLTVASRLGRGTLFTVTLPLAEVGKSAT
jgi:signal transduction histidine kinase